MKTGRPIGSSRLFEKGKRPVCVFLHRHFDTLAVQMPKLSFQKFFEFDINQVFF